MVRRDLPVAGADGSLACSPAESKPSLVISTNSSSIVSKRSVERLYYPKPHFFQYFVHKPRRRSPTINRGYWLRMQAIKSVIRDFLHRPSQKEKIVINLGCGYDPLPFQWLTSETDLCRNVRFVDVDHNELIEKKAGIIRGTKELNDLIQPKDSAESCFQIEGESYCGIGCDMGQLQDLDAAVRSLPGLSNALVLCLAEVSLTYISPKAADKILSWSSTLSDDVTFGLLEQFLPDGPDHPFAKTMLRHFEKLRTPLRSVRTYPTEKCQRQRFLDTGWKAVKFVNLWKLWSSHEFLTLPERMRMNDLEPFDEWEEFALFAAHYFLLTASTSQEQNQGNAVVEKATSSSPSHPAITFALQYTSIPDQSTFRLHGAALALPAGALSDPARVAFVGGMTSQGRSSKVALYQPTKGTRKSTPCCSTKVHARQCHTITRLPNETSLLVGGRASPSAAMQDCYLQTIDGWQQVQDLPEPRYRHSAVGVEACGIDAVLIVGGKSGPNTIQGDILLWDSFHGWRDIPVSGQAIVPRFGATLIGLAHNFGLLVGGMDCNGVILQEKWTWKLNDTDESNTSIEFNLCLCAGDPSAGQYLARFGAKTIRMKYREPGALLNDGALVIGGIGTTACLPQECEILALNRRLVSQTTPPHPPAVILSRVILRRPTDTPRPLFIGHTATGGENGQTLLIGGGAVCFSFGTYWNAGIFYLRHSSYPESDDWTLVQSEKKVNKETEYPGISKNKSEQISHDLKHVSKMSLESAHSFAEMVKSSHPIILEQIDLGSCVQKWNRDYLEHKIGRDRQVVVHEATSRCMHFLRKDFSYVSKPFGDFLSDIQQGAHQYLRSISSSEPSRKVADLGQDFPEIADDFKLPPLLADVVNLYHSSPLRITGDVTMWLHVDTMANILCQIVGSKRIILFPPEDMVKLEFPPGATTSDLDIFPQPGESHMPLRMPPGTHPYEAVIRPGEVLFIPPLWAHTTTPTGANVDADAGDHNGQISIAVNVFFRSLSEGYAPGKDIYGNRDLMAYERGRRHLSQIVNGFDKLPDDLGRAYLLRLADELRAKATEYGGKSGTP